MFIGNLDQDVDEKTLYDTFSAFGMILSTRIMRDPDTGMSKGFAFLSYDTFEASDAAMNAMNGQYFYNKIIHVSYAYKKTPKEVKGTELQQNDFLLQTGLLIKLWELNLCKQTRLRQYLCKNLNKLYICLK